MAILASMEELTALLRDFLAIYPSPAEEAWVRDVVASALAGDAEAEVMELLRAMVQVVHAVKH